MKVTCVTTALSEEMLSAVGGSQRWEMDKKSSLTVGKEYLVYGLEFVIDSDGGDSGTHVMLVPDVGYLVSFRLDYFSISDPRASKHWQVRQWGPTRTTLFPPSFYREGYLEKYCAQDEFAPSEIRDVLDDFEKVSQLLTREAADAAARG